MGWNLKAAESRSRKTKTFSVLWGGRETCVCSRADVFKTARWAGKVRQRDKQATQRRVAEKLMSKRSDQSKEVPTRVIGRQVQIAEKQQGTGPGPGQSEENACGWWAGQTAEASYWTSTGDWAGGGERVGAKGDGWWCAARACCNVNGWQRSIARQPRRHVFFASTLWCDRKTHRQGSSCQQILPALLHPKRQSKARRTRPSRDSRRADKQTERHKADKQTCRTQGDNWNERAG